MPLTAEDVAAIEAMGPAIDEAGIAGDWDAFAAMFAEDLVMMPPNMPALEGRAAWLEWVDYATVPPADGPHSPEQAHSTAHQTGESQ